MASNDLSAPPYTGLKVVELAGDPAGELTGKLLRDLGADVVKVEPPDGSPTRRTGPFVGGVEDQDRSLAYWYYNTGKRSVVVDLSTATGLDQLHGLLAEADVCVTTRRPAEWRDLGQTPDDLRAGNERLIVVSVTPFGLDGPRADWVSSDLVALALGSPLNSCGYDDHRIPPIRPGGDQAFHTAASWAHIGTLLALIDREQTGRGQVVDIAMHDGLAAGGAELANPYWFYPKAIIHRQTCRHAQPEPTQPALFQCADGGYVYFALILADSKPWASLVEWMESHGLAADLTDESYSDIGYRQAHFAHVQGVVEVFFLLLTAAEAYREGQANGLPVGVVNAPEDLLDDEHLEARGFFHTVEHPGVPPARYPGSPYRFSSFEPRLPAAAPRLGEHTAEVLGTGEVGAVGATPRGG